MIFIHYPSAAILHDLVQLFRIYVAKTNSKLNKFVLKEYCNCTEHLHVLSLSYLYHQFPCPCPFLCA